MVMSGLAGATTTMVGATIFALARLLFEFSAALIAAVPDLLPAVLLLIKTHNRETVKAVLGFVRVVCMRLPEGELAPLLPSILEATLVSATLSIRFRLAHRRLSDRRKCMGEG
jgi:ribosomal RNA-processing protein 12